MQAHLQHLQTQVVDDITNVLTVPIRSEEDWQHASYLMTRAYFIRRLAYGDEYDRELLPPEAHSLYQAIRDLQGSIAGSASEYRSDPKLVEFSDTKINSLLALAMDSATSNTFTSRQLLAIANLVVTKYQLLDLTEPVSLKHSDYFFATLKNVFLPPASIEVSAAFRSPRYQHQIQGILLGFLFYRDSRIS